MGLVEKKQVGRPKKNGEFVQIVEDGTIEAPSIIEVPSKFEALKHEILKYLPNNFNAFFDYEAQTVHFKGNIRHINRQGLIINAPYETSLNLNGVNPADIYKLLLIAKII